MSLNLENCIELYNLLPKRASSSVFKKGQRGPLTPTIVVVLETSKPSLDPSIQKYLIYAQRKLIFKY